MGHRKPRSLTKWNPKEHLVRWWASHQISGKTEIIPCNDILIYKLSCFTKVCCRVAVVSGIAMETWPQFIWRPQDPFTSVQRVCLQSAGFPQKSSSGPDHSSAVSAPSPFSLPSTVQAILLGLYLRWILSDFASEASVMFSCRDLHSHRHPASLKTESDQQEDRVALPFPFSTGTDHVSLKELCEIFVPIRY